MPKYEYRSMAADGVTDSVTLNRMAKEGWRFVHSVRVRKTDEVPPLVRDHQRIPARFILYFEREVGVVDCEEA